MNIKQTSSKKKIIILSAITLVLVAASAGWYFYSQSQAKENNVKRDENGVSLERSSDEKAETQKIQDDPENAKQSTNSDTPPSPSVNPSSGLQKVNVVLTSSGVTNGQVDASGFVSNIVEDGGQCTYIFTQNEKVVRKTSTTSTNPTSTTCRTVRFSQTELGTGTWQVILEYASSTSTGTSNIGTLSL